MTTTSPDLWGISRKALPSMPSVSIGFRGDPSSGSHLQRWGKASEEPRVRDVRTRALARIPRAPGGDAASEFIPRCFACPPRSQLHPAGLPVPTHLSLLPVCFTPHSVPLLIDRDLHQLLREMAPGEYRPVFLQYMIQGGEEQAFQLQLWGRTMNGWAGVTRPVLGASTRLPKYDPCGRHSHVAGPCQRVRGDHGDHNDRQSPGHRERRGGGCSPKEGDVI